MAKHRPNDTHSCASGGGNCKYKNPEIGCLNSSCPLYKEVSRVPTAPPDQIKIQRFTQAKVKTTTTFKDREEVDFCCEEQKCDHLKEEIKSLSPPTKFDILKRILLAADTELVILLTSFVLCFVDPVLLWELDYSPISLISFALGAFGIYSLLNREARLDQRWISFTTTSVLTFFIYGLFKDTPTWGLAVTGLHIVLFMFLNIRYVFEISDGGQKD